MKKEEPKWWKAYKEANPGKEEYDPWKHCCSRFWKDWCNCMKEHRKNIKKKKNW
tara:strand:+ start:295 stop:456 length:162 start_codon:yes stop_codon:yes gene_type:complete